MVKGIQVTDLRSKKQQTDLIKIALRWKNIIGLVNRSI